MEFRCGCGRTPDGLRCACGAVYEERPGWRAVRCACGAGVLAAPAQAGTSIPCPSCFLRVEVTADAPAAPPALRRAPRTSTPPPEPSREHLRWLFPLLLVPLLVHATWAPAGDSYRELRERARESRRIQEQQHAVGLDEAFRLLEIDRVGAAWMSRFSMAHWVYAMASAAGFWALILLLFPMGRANSLHLWTVGLAMGTFGVLLLLGFQELARHPALLVGFAYRAAFHPESGFLDSLLGFVFGVGLCEELVKLLPLALVFRRGADLDVRGSIAWGLAMGAGFGVSEAIHYAGHYYNGLAEGTIYLTRFVSVVALHMTWSATAAARLWAWREAIAEGGTVLSAVVPMLRAVGPSILLHGLYNALFKHGAGFAGFFFALLSIAFFFWTADRGHAQERAA